MTEIHSFDSFPITLLVRADIVRLNMQILIATAIERDDAPLRNLPPSRTDSNQGIVGKENPSQVSFRLASAGKYWRMLVSTGECW